MSEPLPSEPATPFETFLHSPLARVLSILLLLLVLRIPVGMVRGLVEERQQRRDLAVHEITGKWGGEQSLLGPVLTVPFGGLPPGGATRPATLARVGTFLPEALHVDGDLASQVRRRGIFEVPVYRTGLRVAGRFAPPRFEGWGAAPDTIQWERAQLSVGLSDPRVIQESVVLRTAGEERRFEAGAGRGPWERGIHASLPLAEGEGSDFAFDLHLHGSAGLWFTPFGRDTSVRLASDWPHPSFQGHWLPGEREVSPDGFAAHWQVPSLGRSYPQRWTGKSAPGDRIGQSRFGVQLDTPVDPYRLALRSAKYDALFVGLTFLALWLFEVLAGVRVHAVQYGMVGAGMALFYLLLLALSEHLGFALAYGLAAGGVIALIASYAVAVLGRGRRGLAIGGVVTSLYGYLYVLLHNQDHALLVGSLGLFVILALVMWLTRRVDWSQALPAPPRIAR